MGARRGERLHGLREKRVLRRPVPTVRPLFRGVAPTEAGAATRAEPSPSLSLVIGPGGVVAGGAEGGRRGGPRVWQPHCDSPLPAPSRAEPHQSGRS